jgi:hypothetical protein
VSECALWSRRTGRASGRREVGRKERDREMRGLDVSGITAEDAAHVQGSRIPRTAPAGAPGRPVRAPALAAGDGALLRGPGHRAPQGGARGLGRAQHRGAARREVLEVSLAGSRIHANYGISAYQVVHSIAWVQGNVIAALLASDRPGKDRETAAWTKLLTAPLAPMLEPYTENGGR